MNLLLLEHHLKLRSEYPYVWGQKQNDYYDRLTKFIYTSRTFEDLQKHCQGVSQEIKNYAYNRWLNFWSARGVEYIFSLHEKVVSEVNTFHKETDFYIDNIPFDHKTTVFPKGYKAGFNYAYKNKVSLIKWLYQHQSSQGRMHFKNRLFVVLYNKSNTKEHWKLKAEICLLQEKINHYLNNFSASELTSLNLKGEVVYADVIWVVQ